jgi:hypothetical protein
METIDLETPLQRFASFAANQKVDEIAAVVDSNTKKIGGAMAEVTQNVLRHEAAISRLINKQFVMEMLLDLLCTKAGVSDDEIAEYSKTFLARAQALDNAAATKNLQEEPRQS